MEWKSDHYHARVMCNRGMSYDFECGDLLLCALAVCFRYRVVCVCVM